MKTIFATILVICFNASCIAQSVTLIPNWKVGETKNIQIISKISKTENGGSELIEQDTLEITITVDSKSDTAYSMSFDYDIVYLNILDRYYEKLGVKPAEDYHHVVAKYSINKTSGELHLVNWPKIKNIVDQTFNQIESAFQSKAPEMTAIISSLISPLKSGFNNETSIRSLLFQHIEIIFIPLGKALTVNEPLKSKIHLQNPMVPDTNINTNRTIDLLSQEANKTVIFVEDKIDQDIIKSQMISMSTDMAKGFGASDASIQKSIDKINDMNILSIKTMEFEINKSTAWPFKIIMKDHLTITSSKNTDEQRIQNIDLLYLLD